ncbi:MAG: Gfo/Idh/MocA family oxidoreductase [Candidatus Hydrogenedentota bacterium]
MARRKIPINNSKTMNRREFIKHTTAVTAGAAVFPMIAPASVFGADGTVAPSNRITMACLGVGGQGRGNLGGFLENKHMHFVAVCDVDKKHRDIASNMINQRNENTDCAHYNEFEEMFERDDLDALSIALPDHWHSIPVIQAADKGLDMYAEKPLALTIGEGRDMVDAVHRNNIVWQTGSWQRSRANFYKGCQLVRNGRIGNVHTVEIGLPTGGPLNEPTPVIPVPQGFDYERWLGPAPWHPYTAKRSHWDFRWILDYSGGQLTDWGAHHNDIFNWGMGTERVGPLDAEGEGDYPRDGIWDAAKSYTIRYRYGKNASPVAPGGFNLVISNKNPGGTRFIGDEGEVHVDRGKFTSTPKNLRSTKFNDNIVELIESTNHAQNFVDNVYSRRECVAPIHAAHQAILLSHLGNICMQLGRKVEWDTETETFKNDPQANRMLRRAMRGHWHV